jgi:predicted transcriptional regulator
MAAKQGKKKRRRVMMSATVDPDLLIRLEAVADALSLNRSQMLEQLVRDGIEEQETYARALSNPLIARALGLAIGQPGVLKAMAAAMGEELQPEQLDLFKRAIEQAVAVGSSEVRPAVKNSLVKKKKRGDA